MLKKKKRENQCSTFDLIFSCHALRFDIIHKRNSRINAFRNEVHFKDKTHKSFLKSQSQMASSVRGKKIDLPEYKASSGVLRKGRCGQLDDMTLLWQ